MPLLFLPWDIQSLSLPRLLSYAREPHCEVTLALAGVMSMASHRPPGYATPIAGLSLQEQSAMLDCLFINLPWRWSIQDERPDRLDEFDDLVHLLAMNVSEVSQASGWLVHAVATACMGANHLWQDMGLAQRSELNSLMLRYFAPLKQLNQDDMRWKKFFYRQLCLQEEILICKSPSCAQCVDHAACFGPEAGASLVQASPGSTLIRI